MNQTCPVCAFSELPYPPENYHICPCCGTEFGNDDAYYSHAQLREMWVATGAHWFFGNAPAGWNPWLQLITGNHAEAVYPKIELTFLGDGNVVDYTKQGDSLTLELQG